MSKLAMEKLAQDNEAEADAMELEMYLDEQEKQDALDAELHEAHAQPGSPVVDLLDRLKGEESRLHTAIRARRAVARPVLSLPKGRGDMRSFANGLARSIHSFNRAAVSAGALNRECDAERIEGAWADGPQSTDGYDEPESQAVRP